MEPRKKKKTRGTKNAEEVVKITGKNNYKLSQFIS